jgi:hypothetical protein
VFVKKAVYLAAEAWRREYGRAVRHSALKDGGGEILQFNRAGMDPYPLIGWKKVVPDDGSRITYEGPHGEVYEDLEQVYEYEIATKHAEAGADSTKVHLSILQQFLNDCCTEKGERTEADMRVVITTSTLEDWLNRGDHPILKPMSLQVYCMWVYRIEKPHRNPGQQQRARFVDLEFSPQYSLHGTHLQRLASELRVPLFEGFTMPSQDTCSETAAMFKQLLLRPLSVPCTDEPADIQLVQAFSPLCAPGDGATAYGRSWLRFSAQQRANAEVARLRFLDRHEYPSIWETAEVCEALHEMYLAQAAADEEDGQPDVAPPAQVLDPEWCPDRAKPRATVEQYTAHVGEDVAVNLEGIARARSDKRPRQYQSDAAIHQAYIQSTTGGVDPADQDEAKEAEPSGEGPKAVKSFFEPVPWGITSTAEVEKILDFGHRVRLTPFAKELLQLPCMQPGAADAATPSAVRVERGEDWRMHYARIAAADESELIDILGIQDARLQANHADDELDVVNVGDTGADTPARPAQPACFADQNVFSLPSAYIASLIANLPADEQLTRDQSLFMVQFAKCCDRVWEDDGKAPSLRRIHHLLLLGQGGSGKTHVVQKLVFPAVEFIWPPVSRAEPTLIVVASSNAQAKNISTQTVKGRTIHNASGMRVQKLTNDRMRPGNKQASLTKFWDHARVLVIEECSMVAALWYNMWLALGVGFMYTASCANGSTGSTAPMRAAGISRLQ